MCFNRCSIITEILLENMSFSSRANVFLLVNLGCEMLYVIDQRLVAQAISIEKSTQVIRDITSVLLEPKFIHSFILGSQKPNAQLLTVEHCKFMLSDIACCSLMQLDQNSMDKLWNLMTMILKWQIFVTQSSQHLLDITFRHLDTVGQIHADVKRTILVDHIKNVLLDFWNSIDDVEQMKIYRTCQSWLECFNTKISLLIRLGFQYLDATFIRNVSESYFVDFVETAGENIYVKSVEVKKQKEEIENNQSAGGKVNQLVSMLKSDATSSIGDDIINEPLKNIVLDDVNQLNFNPKEESNVNLDEQSKSAIVNKTESFVRLQPVYKNAQATSSGAWEEFVANRGGTKRMASTTVDPNVSIQAAGMECRNILSRICNEE